MSAITPTTQNLQHAVELLRSLQVEGLCISGDDGNNNFSLSHFLPICSQKETNVDDFRIQDTEYESAGANARFFLYNTIAVTLNLLLLAVVAGVYLGLLSLDVLDLQILERTSNDEDERKYARELIPIVKERHLLLVTMLYMDTISYESLPIFLEVLVPGWAAVLLSSTLILVIGEILPAAIFTGPNQLYLGYVMAPAVRFVLWALYPLAKPVARLLDYLTRDEEDNSNGEAYNRGELSALVRIQYEERMKKSAPAAMRHNTVKEVMKYQRNKDRQWNDLKAEIIERVNEMHDEKSEHDDEDENSTCGTMDQLLPPLHPTEINMVEGALALGTKLAMDVYTPLRHVYCLPSNSCIDSLSVADIYSEGYSRVPVYAPDPNDEDEKSGFLGYLSTRHLIMICKQDNRKLSTLYLTRPACISPRMNLIQVLKTLQSDAPQMLFVCARPDLGNKALDAEEPVPVEAGLMGIITLVDIMEAILQERIYDENDVRERDRAVATLKRWAATKLQAFLRKAANEIKIKRRFSTGSTKNSTSTRNEHGDLHAVESNEYDESRENFIV